MSKTTIAAKIHPDGRVIKVSNEGSEATFPRRAMRSMNEEEVAAAAAGRTSDDA